MSEQFDRALTLYRSGEITEAEFCRVMRHLDVPDQTIEHLIQQSNSEAA